MEQEPSARRGRSSTGVGSKAAARGWPLHIRYQDQEETLKVSKFGWLAAVLAVAALVGAVGFGATPADAAVTGATKACGPSGTQNQAVCNLTINENALAPGNTYTITLTPASPAQFLQQLNPAIPTAAVSDPDCTATITSFSATQIVVTLGGNANCTGAGTVTVNELLSVTGSGTISQTVTGGGATSGTATANATGVPAFVANVPSSVVKTCTTPPVGGQPAGTILVNTPVTCTTTVTFPTAPTTPVSGTIAVQNGTLNSPAGGTFTCPAGNAVCTVSESITATTVGVIPTQTVTIAGTTFNVPLGGVTGVVRVAAFVTTINPAGCIDVTPPPPATNPTFAPIGPTLTLGVNETRRIQCRLDIDDNSPTPDLVYSGIVTVTVGSTAGNAPTLIAIGTNNTDTSGTVQGNTGTVRCGAQNTADSCNDVFVTFSVTGRAGAGGALPFTQNITVTASYVPDNDQQNTPADLSATTLFSVVTQAATAGFRQPAGLAFDCTAGPRGTAPGVPTPGEISSVTNLQAVGILPAIIICTVVPVNADGDPIRAAPATIEVSSVNGVLLDTAGRLTTNLRIGCGTRTDVAANLTTIDPNTCEGVTFAVAGQGVGVVELRARYEPSAAAAAAGIVDVEATARVAFVAPIPSLLLSLSPNPVAVNGTGTATLSFQFGFQLCSPLGSAFQVFCVNPQTGLPIPQIAGSVLAGTVVFTSQNPSAAQFVTAGTATTTAGLPGGQTGVTTGSAVAATAQQVVVRCGSLSNVAGALETGSGTFASFFNGCQTATAVYRGIAIGTSDITATFIPDLPGALSGLGGVSGLGALISATTVDPVFGLQVPSRTVTLQVLGATPANTDRLVSGCNNVVARGGETPAAVAARVDPASAAISVWQQVAGTTQFRGAAIGGNVPASVSNLETIMGTGPQAVFICVNAAATYTRPS